MENIFPYLKLIKRQIFFKYTRLSCIADQVALNELSSASKLVIFLLRLYYIRPESLVTGNVSFIRLYSAEIHCFLGNELRKPELVRGSTPEKCSPNRFPSSPLPSHILESPDK